MYRHCSWMVIESQLPDGKMVSLGIPVNDCYYTGTMMDGSGTVAISQCNSEMVRSLTLRSSDCINNTCSYIVYMTTSVKCLLSCVF